MSGVFQNIDPPPPLHPASVSSPRTKGGGVVGWGVTILEEARHRIGLLQYNLSTASAFAGAAPDFLIALVLNRDLNWVGIRTRTCHSAGRRTAIRVTPHPSYSTPHPELRHTLSYVASFLSFIFFHKETYSI